MRNYIDCVKGNISGSFKVECRTDSFTTELIHALREIWNPFCITGNLNEDGRYDSADDSERLFMSSTLSKLNVPELLAHATPSASDQGAENSFEINASLLHYQTLGSINQFVELTNFMPNVFIEKRYYKLVIYEEGGHFDAHRDTVRGDGHIGTLVVILNSTYTGGELEVTHGGRTEVVTGPYSWVAMYGDCLHKINPVTSGTLVLVIIDLFTRHKEPLPKPDNRSGYMQSAHNEVYSYANPARAAAAAVPISAGEDDNHGSCNEHSSAGGSPHNEQEGEGDEEEEDEEEVDEEDEQEGEEGDYMYDYSSDDSYEQTSAACAQSDLWNRHYKRLDDATDARARGADEALQVKIRQAVNKELQRYDTLIICLRHLYPECQVQPSALKGGDRALYDIFMLNDDLRADDSSLNTGLYEIEVVAATIYRANDPEFHHDNTVHGRLFSPDIVEQTLSEAARQKAASRRFSPHRDASASEPENKKQRTGERTKLIIPNEMNCGQLLEYIPYIEDINEETQPEENVYIVAGLQVRWKI